MTNGIEQGVGDFKPKDRRAVPFSEFTKDDIAPGVVISFSSANQLDEFMMQIGKMTKFEFSREHENTIINNAQFSKGSVSEMLKTQEKLKKYFGPLKNFRLTILPSDTTFLNNPEDVFPNTISTFLAEADIHSSGVGKVAEVHILCSFYIRNKSDFHNKGKTPHVSYSGKPVQQAPLIPDNADINPRSRKILTLVIINKKQNS